MRIPIRIQLGSLLLLSSLAGLAVISVATWITTQRFVLEIRASRLALTASLKAAQLASNLDVMQTSVGFITTRVLVQRALSRYNLSGNNTETNWNSTRSDIQAAIGGGGSLGQQLLMQARIYPKNASGPSGSDSLVNSTADALAGRIPLPYFLPNGSRAYLGDTRPAFSPYAFPPDLYPNLTYFSENGVQHARYEDKVITKDSTLLLGPLAINDTFSLLSLTMPIMNNSATTDALGYLTVIMNGRLVSQVIKSSEGLGDTGHVLLIGPATKSNILPITLSFKGKSKPAVAVHYVLPLNETYEKRHPDHARRIEDVPFDAASFPLIYNALRTKGQAEQSGASLHAKNEAGKPVSVGYAMLNTNMVDWTVMLEMSRSEVWRPINILRKVILGCLFATAGLMALIAFPLAHFASQPILRLREATRRSINAQSMSGTSSLGSLAYLADGTGGEMPPQQLDVTTARKEGFSLPSVSKWRRKRGEAAQAKRFERERRAFRIPGKVRERKCWIKDELSDLTETFNEMSDELMMQYSKLEERVQQRTAELELSKKAAEAANESKTLFIANISHELKTPLNGILGMCAVCMQEDDPLRLKRSLGIIYKSGDLLLNLLTDLLTFSKNQVGQHLSLDEKEFRLRDISSQTMAIFDKQARDGNIDLRVQYDGIRNGTKEISPDRQSNHGPSGTGPMRDMILWGDVHRILQVVINLMSNALKFTPPGETVVLTIRCLPEVPTGLGSRKTSTNSRHSRQPPSAKHRNSDLSVTTGQRMSTANAINVKDKPHALSYVTERATTPPPGRYVWFEFEVADTGPGMPENILEKIFEPFVQGDLGLSKKYGGTGLGLSICSQLAALMKGSMSVRSTLGQGSTFTLKVPLRHLHTRVDSSASSAMERPDISRSSSLDRVDREASLHSGHGPVEYRPDIPSPSESVGTISAPAAETSNTRLVGLSQPFFATNQPLESPNSQPAAMKQITASAARSGKIRVLVAEDNKVNQEVVLRMLKLEDIYDVTVAKDGQEALDMVKASMDGDGSPYNLIFMDVQMPNVDGLTSTRLIREIGYSAPIVALTAFAEESNIKDCLDSGMNYFLAKPIRRPQLKKVLKEYCAPIPEEDEEVGSSSSALERPSSGVNTTVVVVSPTTDDDPSHPSGRMPPIDAEREPFSRLSTSTIGEDELRPASPRTVVS